MKKINVAELLKDCPKGMELDCILFKDTQVYLWNITTDIYYPIEIKVEYPSKELETFSLNKYGAIYNRPTAKCVIFPKGKTTWEGFKRPFKDGDIITDGEFIAIFYKFESEHLYYHCWIHKTVNNAKFKDGYGIGFIDDYVYATEEEKQELFDAIKDNGYKWNSKTKTLEKIVVPEFKVGDIIQDEDGYKVKITEVNLEDKWYDYESVIAKGIGGICFGEEDNWKLVPDKFDITTFKPFDKVLVRLDSDNNWYASLFSHIDDLKSFCNKLVTTAGKSYTQMIPYNEETKHLLGTNKDCPEYYKINW